MNFEKISNQALRNAIDVYLEEMRLKQNQGHSEFELQIGDEDFRNDVKLIGMLQKFGSIVSTEAIKLYHEELSTKLKKQGIDI